MVEGHRKIQVNDEEWEFSLTGIVRPEDLMPNNTVPSKKIANLRIYKRQAGHGRDGIRRGWLQKWMDEISTVLEETVGLASLDPPYRTPPYQRSSNQQDQRISIAVIVPLGLCLLATTVEAKIMLKTICQLKGQENTLQGLGIVVGLKGTGDSIRLCPRCEAWLRSCSIWATRWEKPGSRISRTPRTSPWCS